MRESFGSEKLPGIGRATQLAIEAAQDAVNDAGLTAAELMEADISASGTTMGEPEMIEREKASACIQADAISAGVARVSSIPRAIT